jgi:hypothetical protein
MTAGSRRVVAVVGVALVAALAGLGTAGCELPGQATQPAADAADTAGTDGTGSAPAKSGPQPAASGNTTASPPATGAAVTGAAATGAAVTGYAPPPANAGFDYQIGGAYPLPAGVTVVSRDHTDAPDAGAYNICYVNGFQAQPEAAGWWQKNHDDLLLKRDGEYFVDENWDEILLDITTPAKRDALLGIVGGWIDGCAANGFRGVEVDNLDSWTRSGGLVTQADAVAYATLLAARAHASGLAIAQKNAVELSRTGRTEVGFDFAIAESCMEYDECDGYTVVYGDRVIVIEYAGWSFRRACDRYGARLSIVRRDEDVSVPGSSSYVFAGC